MRRVPMLMDDWITKLNAFLTLNERDILDHAGKISHKMAAELAEGECEKFSRDRVQESDRAGGDFDAALKRLPAPPKRKKAGRK